MQWTLPRAICGARLAAGLLPPGGFAGEASCDCWHCSSITNPPAPQSRCHGGERGTDAAHLLPGGLGCHGGLEMKCINN